MVAVGALGTVAPLSASDGVGRIAHIDGIGMVTDGARFIPAAEGMALQTGDRLLVLEGGNVTVWYGDGCEFRLTDDHILDVGGESTCALGAGGRYVPSLAVATALDDSAVSGAAQSSGGLAQRTQVQVSQAVYDGVPRSAEWLLAQADTSGVGGGGGDDDDDDTKGGILLGASTSTLTGLVITGAITAGAIINAFTDGRGGGSGVLSQP